MAVFANDFTFNGISLSSISQSYALVSFDNGSDSSAIMNRSVERSEITYDRVLTDDYGAVDSNVMQFDITICNACDRTGESFTKDEIKKIIGWLTSPVEPKLLYFTGDGTEIYTGLQFIGRFTKAEYVGRGGNYKDGIKAYFENVSPYAFTEEQTYTINSYSDSNGVLDITNTGTATGKIVIPKITISVLDSGKITVNNTSDTSMDAFSFTGTQGDVITINNYNLFKADGTLFDFDKCDNLNFPVMLDGVNTFSVTGHCTVTITVRYFEDIGI